METPGLHAGQDECHQGSSHRSMRTNEITVFEGFVLVEWNRETIREFLHKYLFFHLFRDAI